MTLGWGQTWTSRLASGLVAILFGIVVLVWPGITALVLVYLFAAWLLVTGLVELFAAFAAPGGAGGSCLLAAAGILSILIGIAAFAWPLVTGLAVVYIIAIWAIVRGVVELLAAVGGSGVRDRGLLVVSGAIAILFGIALLVYPLAGAAALIVIVGIFALIYGLLQVISALRLRQATR
ncbi:MAG: HdeD family acid-resistance protein [Anaerolineae bacterium]